MFSSKKLRSKSRCFQETPISWKRNNIFPPVVRLYMTLSVTAVSSSWMLDKLPHGFCFLNEYLSLLFFLSMFLSIIHDGLCPQKCLGFALITPVYQCGSQPFQLLLIVKYFVLVSTHSLHWSFLSQKGTVPCQHCRIQAVTCHLSPALMSDHPCWLDGDARK